MHEKIIIIYFSSGKDPFSDSIVHLNKFIRQLYSKLTIDDKSTCSLALDTLWININSQILLSEDGEEVKFFRDEKDEPYLQSLHNDSILSFDEGYKADCSEFKNKVKGVNYNGMDIDYNPEDIEQIKSNAPRFNWNFKNQKSAEFYSKWLDEKIARNTDTKVLIIDGFGGNGRNIPNFTLKSFEKYKDNPNVKFLASCSCCFNAEIKNDPRQNPVSEFPITGLSTTDIKKYDNFINNFTVNRSGIDHEIQDFTDKVINFLKNQHNISLDSMKELEETKKLSFNLNTSISQTSDIYIDNTKKLNDVSYSKSPTVNKNL